MFKGVSTLVEFEECVQKGLCEEHLQEITQSELTAAKIEFSRNAFKYVRVNILYPLLHKKSPKCDKIKKLMEKTPPIAKILVGRDLTEDAASVILTVDSVIVFTLCLLSKICCIGAIFHTIKRSNCTDPNIKAIEKLILVEKFENAEIRYLYPVLQKNFIGCDLDIIRATHCITLLFIRKFCNKQSIKIAIETIESDMNKFEPIVFYEDPKNHKLKFSPALSHPALNCYNTESYMNMAKYLFTNSKFKLSAMYCYLAVSVDHTCSKAYCLYVQSLLHLKMYEEAREVIEYGLKNGKKETKFYKNLIKCSEDMNTKYLEPNISELSNSIDNNSINHIASANKIKPIKNGKSKSQAVDLVDSDSGESDSDSKKDVAQLPDIDPADEPVVPGKKSTINLLKEKTKAKVTGTTKKKRTISEGSVDTLPEEEMDVKKITSFLKEASELLVADCGYKAVQIFRGPLRSFIDSANFPSFEECDIVCIKYSYGVAYCKSGGYDDLQKCIAIFKDILKSHDSIQFPAAYYALGLAYRKLNRFKDALHYLEIVDNFLSKGIHFKVYPWPGLTTVIQETKPDVLKTSVQDLIKECENPPNPDAFCRYENCSFQPTIYYTDPDFKGYVSVACSEQCCMQYHWQCWKSIKEDRNLTDKEFLERSCFTPDCEGVIMKIQNIDRKGDLSKEFISDFKKPSKPKWTKMEKKAEKEKRKKKTSLRSEEGSQEVLPGNERVRSRTNSHVGDETDSNSTVDETSSKSDHGPDSRNAAQVTVTRGNFLNNNNNVNSSGLVNGDSASVAPSSDKKTAPEGNQSEISLMKNIKDNVYSFMADYLQHHGPLRIDDPLLTSEIESFPDDVHKIISEYGSVGEFLKNDLRFAFVGDIYICVIDDVATAYQMLNNSILLSGLDGADDLKYCDEGGKTFGDRRSSFGLNPDAVEYRPVDFATGNKCNSYKFSMNGAYSKDSVSNISLPAGLPTKDYSHSSSQLDTFPDAELLLSKSRSCEIVLNDKFLNNPKSVYSGSVCPDKSDSVDKSKLMAEPVVSGAKFSSQKSNPCFSEGDRGDASSHGSATTSSCKNMDKFNVVKTMLVKCLEEYFSKETQQFWLSNDPLLKPYVIKKAAQCANSATMTDPALEVPERESSDEKDDVIEDLKTEIYELSRKNAHLQQVAETAREEKQKVVKDSTSLQKLLLDTTGELEGLQQKFLDIKHSADENQRMYDVNAAAATKLKKLSESLLEEKMSLKKEVENLKSSLKKGDEKMNNALDAQKKELDSVIKTLQDENTGLKDKVNEAEVLVLRTKKDLYLKLVHDRAREAAEMQRNMNASLPLMAAASPSLNNCIQLFRSKFSVYLNELNLLEKDFTKRMDAHIKKVEGGASLKDLGSIPTVEIPSVPTWTSIFPNGPSTDPSRYNLLSMPPNFMGIGAGIPNAQVPPAAVAPPTAPVTQVLPPGVSAPSKVKPPTAAPIKPPMAAAVKLTPPTTPDVPVVPLAVPPVVTSSSSVPAPPSIAPVLNENKAGKKDISDDIDLASIDPTIQESFKSGMASINSFASKPYSAPSLDDEFDKKCVVFKHPDAVPNGKPIIPKVPPPGLVNPVLSSALNGAAKIPVSEIVPETLATSVNKSYESLDAVPKIKPNPGQSTWEQEKRKAHSAGKNSYEKLLNKLKEQFPSYSQDDLLLFVKEFRAQRKGTLSGLTMDKIISEISTIIEAKKKKVFEAKAPLPKSTKVLVNKKLVPDPRPACESGGEQKTTTKKKTAWNIERDAGQQRNFAGSADDDCTICCDPMTSASAYKVACGHTFHEDCIRQWLKKNSNCPMCRVLLLLPEEYPSLS